MDSYAVASFITYTKGEIVFLRQNNYQQSQVMLLLRKLFAKRRDLFGIYIRIENTNGDVSKWGLKLQLVATNVFAKQSDLA